MAKSVQNTPLRAKGRGPKIRRARVRHIGELVGATMGDMLAKRGFASSDLVTNWCDIVPAPYDTNVVPDKLKWPRGSANAMPEGGVLHVRVAAAHALTLQHEVPMLMARINGYFGFELVSDIRLMQIPLQRTPVFTTPEPEPATPQELAEQSQKIDDSLDGLADSPLKESLRKLGTSILSAPKK